MFANGSSYNGPSAYNGSNATLSNGNSFGSRNTEPFFWKYLDSIQDQL